MAVLSDTDRARTAIHVMRNVMSVFGTMPVNKTDLRAAIDAADTWADSNQASFVTALPQPFRGASSAQQKTLLLCWVIMRRAGLLRVVEDG